DRLVDGACVGGVGERASDARPGGLEDERERGGGGDGQLDGADEDEGGRQPGDARRQRGQATARQRPDPQPADEAHQDEEEGEVGGAEPVGVDAEPHRLVAEGDEPRGEAEEEDGPYGRCLTHAYDLLPCFGGFTSSRSRTSSSSP